MSKSLKTLECNRCGIEVHKVSLEAVTVLCWLCSMKNISLYEKPDGSTDTTELSETTRNNREGN